MQNFKTILLTTTLLVSSVAMAGPASIKVIYGEDGREDVFASTNGLHIKLAKSTAAMIPSYKVEEHNAYEVKLAGSTLEQRGMCASEKFSQQPTTANCSGFLVDKDKIVTAGHCIRNESDCSSNSWVFDFKVDHEFQSEVIVSKESVYKCKKIISQSLDSETQNDYALIQLDKPVTDRDPLAFRTKGKPSVGDELVVIGHPTGLPTKITSGAKIRSVNDVFFVANLDTYGGNSGSAVFNASTGVIEGILVRGAQDYVYDSAQGCRVSNVLGNDEGRGEDVTLITNIKELMDIKPPTVDPKPPVEDPKPEPPKKPRLPAWLRWLLGL
jgi:V8-like Glu-specific endopeptidase